MNNVERAKKAKSKAIQMFGGKGPIAIQHNFQNGMYKCSNLEVQTGKTNIVKDTLNNVPRFHGSITEFIDDECKDDGSEIKTTIKQKKNNTEVNENG